MTKAFKEFQGIQTKIYTIRGIKVMLDRDLAELYQVSTGNLNLAVKRNIDRFPADFMFQLTKEELRDWLLQFARSNSEKMGLRYAPYAFTEMGIAMLSSVLKSKIAIHINIRIMRAFVELRQIIAAQPEYEILKEKIKRIESDTNALKAEASEIKMGQLVESRLVAGRFSHMQEDVQELTKKIQKVSETFDEFQATHILIQRPDDGLIKG